MALAGCGGGVLFVYGSTGFDNVPPSVSVASNISTARPGDTVRIVAAATDDTGVDHVTFFRVDPAGGTAFTLGSVGSAPYQLDVQLPLDASGFVQFFARAVDRDGNTAQSNVVSVQVLTL